MDATDADSVILIAVFNAQDVLMQQPLGKMCCVETAESVPKQQ